MIPFVSGFMASGDYYVVEDVFQYYPLREGPAHTTYTADMITKVVTSLDSLPRQGRTFILEDHFSEPCGSRLRLADFCFSGCFRTIPDDWQRPASEGHCAPLSVLTPLERDRSELSEPRERGVGLLSEAVTHGDTLVRARVAEHLRSRQLLPETTG